MWPAYKLTRQEVEWLGAHLIGLGRTGRRGNIVARGDLPMGWSLITSLKANKCWYELCCLWLA